MVLFVSLKGLRNHIYFKVTVDSYNPCHINISIVAELGTEKVLRGKEHQKAK